VLVGNGNGVNYLNNDKVFLDIYGHHRKRIHLKKVFTLMILQIIDVSIDLCIYLNCEFFRFTFLANKIISNRGYQNQQRTTNDDDQESGTGNSIPQSPFREHEASYVKRIISIPIRSSDIDHA
jgi:hypothetical protein